MRAASARTRVFPDPAGALSTETSRPSVRTASAAAAWSSRSPLPRARILRVARVLRLARVARVRVPVSASSSRAGSAPSACAACARGHARRAVRAGLRDHALFHGQLRARRVPGTAVPLVDAAPVRAPQAGRQLGQLGCLQAGHRLKLRSQRPVRPGPPAARRPRPGPGRSRGRTRPRYLTTSARVHALLSCCASATAFCAARASSSSEREPGPARPRVARAAARRLWPCQTDGATERQAHAERARELVRPARVRLREIQPAVLRVARGEVRRLREVRELALGRRAAIPLLEPRRAAPQVRSDRLAARGEHAASSRR